MQKDILFSGVTLTPYSDTSEDGQLSVSHNIEVYNRSLRPSVIDGKEITLPSGSKILYIHATQTYRHLIYEYNQDLYYTDIDNENTVVSDVDHLIFNIGYGVASISHIGNSLCIMEVGRPMYYLLWYGDKYADLGEFPELTANFALIGRPQSKKFTGSGTFDNGFDDYNRFCSYITQFITEYCSCEGGKFVFPFFVRAAYRLFDGSHIKHTSPVLMIPNSFGPFEFMDSDDGKAWVAANVMALQCRFSSIPEKWSSIIQGVDVFVSSPLDPYVYDWKEGINKYTISDRDGYNINYGIGKLTTTTDSASGIKSTCKYCSFGQYGMYTNSIAALTPSLKEDGVYHPEDTSSFYLIKRFSFKEIPTSFHTIVMPEKYYDNLTFKELLEDDYDGSHDVLMPNYSYAYNSRLNIVVDKIKYFVGNDFENIMAYQNGNTYTESGQTVYFSLFFMTERNGVQIWHKVGRTSILGYVYCLNWMYTPNNAVRKVCIRKEVGSTYSYFSNSMDSHTYLNGYYFMKKWCDVDYSLINAVDELATEFDKSDVNLGSLNTDDKETLKNIVYTSAVNNLFKFPVEGQNQIGSGRIIAVAAVNKPLSQGQFGQYPLMAFCSDGNYALEVNSDGLYSSVKPMSRDVCINAASITPIDGSIVFCTAQGVMLFDGNTINCISKDLEGVADSFALLASELSDGSGYVTNPLSFISNITFAWDYAKQRLISLSPGKTKCMVRSFSDNLWSSVDLPASFVNSINSYPYSFIQYNNGKVTILDETRRFSSLSSVSGTIVTRPIKLDTYLLKRINSFYIQGIMGGTMNLSLYASQDCKTWDLIGNTTCLRVVRLKGYYYKYIRFVLKPVLSQSDNITALRIDYTTRNENRLR